ncbi:MAG: GTP cyclohydrolase I FolE [Saprospiraceae bacterium]|nr:GTP cyclohydrolase I FolE [Saprospiraceae bacterium]
MHNNIILEEEIDNIGDFHLATSIDTPLRDDAFDLSDNEKIKIISKHFRVIMETLGLDLTDDSLNGTPLRVAKMFVKEKFMGLNKMNKPGISLFENSYQYNKMLIERNIRVESTCEHHFLPIVGIANVAYVSSGKVIGLSKINRLVDYYSRRPQVQERLTKQILEALKDALQTEDVIVTIDAKHHCVSSRGIEDPHSSTVTMEYGGVFENIEYRKEFLSLL